MMLYENNERIILYYMAITFMMLFRPIAGVGCLRFLNSLPNLLKWWQRSNSTSAEEVVRFQRLLPNRSRTVQPYPSINVAGADVPISNKIKTLGIILDSPLILMSPLFVHHVSSTSVTFNTFGPISRKTWQSRLQSLKSLHALINVILSCMAPQKLTFINCRGFKMSLPNWSVLVMLARPMLSAV